jgi:hypothetical protein
MLCTIQSVTDFFGWYNYRQFFFFFKYFFYLASIVVSTTPPYLVPPRCQGQHPDHGAPPPLTKIMPKHDENLGGIGKKTLTDSWGQCVIDLMQRPKKKHKYSIKNIPFVREHTGQRPTT